MFFYDESLIPKRYTNHFYPLCLTLRIVILLILNVECFGFFCHLSYFQMKVYNLKLKVLNVLEVQNDFQL